jgi:hypothetical protein
VIHIRYDKECIIERLQEVQLYKRDEMSRLNVSDGEHAKTNPMQLENIHTTFQRPIRRLRKEIGRIFDDFNIKFAFFW